jgi:hypothetical protein
MPTNIRYEDRLDGASNYVQWKMRSVDDRKLWSITVTIARSVLLTWGFLVPGKSYQKPWDPGGISKQSSRRLQKVLAQQRSREQVALVQREQVVEVRVASSSAQEQGAMVQRELATQVQKEQVAPIQREQLALEFVARAGSSTLGGV